MPDFFVLKIIMTSPNMGNAGDLAPQKFIFFSDQVVTFCADFAQIPVQDHTASSLQVELDDLERRWRQLVQIYENEMTSSDPTVTKDARGEIHGKFTECCRSYKECKSSILDLIQIENQKFLNSEPISKEENVSHTDRVFSLKVPPCDTEFFSGGYDKWPSFRDMFSAVYINHTKLSPAQKLFHLRAKTKGEASMIVKRFSLTDNNFELAWNALRQRFENKRILINHQLRKIFQIEHVSVEKEKSLRNLQYTINNCLSVLHTYNISVISWDPILVYWVSSKLPEDTLTAWESSLSNNKEMPSWDQLDEFITKRLNMIESVSDIRKPHSSTSQKVSAYNTSTEGSPKACKVCKQNHPLRNCSKFRSWPLSDKRKFVFDNKICENCLSYGHIAKKCKSEHRCQSCRQSHHTLLHPDESNKKIIVSNVSNQNWQKPKSASAYLVETFEDEKPTTSEAASSAYNEMSYVESHFSQSGERTVLPTALIDLEHQGFLFTIRAFIDQGSQETFISSRIINRFDIPTKKSFTKISGLGGTLLENSSKSCQVTLKSRKSDFKIATSAIVVSNLNHLMPAFPTAISDFTTLKRLELADPKFFKPAPIDMLIGSDILPSIIKPGLKKNISGNLLAQCTEFGWIVSGKPNCQLIASFASWTATYDPLSEELRKFWEIENISNEKTLSASDIWCEEFYKRTVQRRSDGRYVVRLPFKQDLPSDKYLGSSRSAAMGQYLRMEKTLEKNPDIAGEYNKVLSEYVTLGHMELTTKFEISENLHFRSYYLPHHAVVKPDRTSTKVRVVFNASKRTDNGVSLNDILYTGPTLQNELTNVVLRWRFFKYVFNGDIQKMYRQIFVHEKDQQFQRILFRSSPLEKVEDYCLKTVTFGVNCAPYLAIRTLLQLSDENKHSHPTASNILKSQIYVDDILSGAHSLTEAKSYLHEVIDLLKSAGFPLKKITSNHPQILLNLPPEDLLSEDFLRLEDVSETKTLGIQWNAKYDYFFYKVTHFDLPTVAITKRKVLSIVAKLFDPAGWLTPIIVVAKVLMQQLWIDGTNWDEEVTTHSFEKWNAFISKFEDIENIKIPRWVHFSSETEIQIHGFCDASEKAYCACLYIRVKSSKNITYTNLLVSKSKVAPLKTVSLPRLELCGAAMLSKLLKSVCQNLELSSPEIFLWTDSTITLSWISKPPFYWKTFVANKVSEILDNVGNANWRHVASADNPADLGTRGCTAEELQACSLWWHGPHWLAKEPQHWPKPASLKEPELEKKVFAMHAQVVGDDLLEDFSSLNRVLRVFAYAFRFINGCRRNNPSGLRKNILLAHEISFVKYYLIRLAQRIHYPWEYQALVSNQPIPTKSRLLTLNPTLDENMLLRVNGRLANSDARYNERHPIILPEKSRFCKLLIEFTHILLLHAEHQLMIRAIRQEFYIIRLKSAVRSCIHNCRTCTIYKHHIQNQIMAALPLERCTFSLPFTNTGLDFAGPFDLKTSRLRNARLHKGYAAIFVCLSTRAIHLEVCSDLSAEAFLATFSRFVGRRGLPKQIFSDNGTNFVGASRSLAKDYKTFLRSAEEHLVSKYNIHGFTWHFIPPHAPHMGGLWEAAVKSMKAHLKKVAGKLKYTYEEFSTLLIRIESILNSRPLSPLNEEPSELVPLTPGHLLRGAPLIATPEPSSDNLSLMNRWQRLKTLQSHFAKRWKNEYITNLQRRYKWKRTQRDLAPDNFVVIKEDNLPPTEWRLGRVVRVFAGKDSRVRVAEIRTQNGIIVRPLVKLCILPNC